MDTFLQDLRYAIRSLAVRPAVLAVATLSLAIGISANTTIFAALDAYLIRPLPYPDPDQLAQVWTTNRSRDWSSAGTSVPDYLDWQRDLKGAELSANVGAAFNMAGGDRPERVIGARVTPSFFRVFGVRPATGRAFLDEEGTPGRTGSAVLSDAFWRRRFAADAGVIGRKLLLDGASYTVVGIMPPDFKMPSSETDVWIPLAFDGTELRSMRNLDVIGRVKPNVSIPGAENELKSVAARLAKTYTEDDGISARMIRLDREIYDDDFRRGATISTVAVVFVLLIACANVANILLARASARGREIALRTALGAGRARIVRQLLTESLVLALGGGVLGTVLSIWGIRALVSIIPAQFARTETIALNGRALVFTLGLALASGLIFGLAPSLQATRGSVSGTLREGGRGGTMGLRRNRLGGSLVVAEISLALVLLICAGLLIKSSIRLQLVKLGFEVQNVLTMSVTIPEAQYADSNKVVALQTELLHRLRAMPGAVDAGGVTSLPLRGGYFTSYAIEGEPRPEDGREPITQFRGATTGYFASMGIGLLRGRDFTEQDRAGAPNVLIANEAFVKRQWPDRSVDPLGKRVIFGRGDRQVVREIVGVVRSTHEFGPDDESPAVVFIPALQRGYRSLSFVVRTSGDPGAMASTARGVLRDLDPTLPGYNIRTMEEVKRIEQQGDDIMPRLLGVFGAAALVLAIIGVYGVMSYSVSQRTREVGVRMALGAQRRDIVRLVVGQGALIAGIGLGIGLLLAAGSTRGLGFFLMGVSAYDPTIFSGVTVALGISAIVASYIPARRALRVDPLVALQAE